MVYATNPFELLTVYYFPAGSVFSPDITWCATGVQTHNKLKILTAHIFKFEFVCFSFGCLPRTFVYCVDELKINVFDICT